MATLDKYNLPRLTYGWLPEYVDRAYSFDGTGRRFVLRPGQSLAMLDRIVDVSHNTYFSVGYTHVYRNGGTTAPDLPVSKRAGIILGNFLLDPRIDPKGVTTEVFGANISESEVTERINTEYSQEANKAGFVTDEIDENLANTDWNSLPISRFFGQQMQAKFDEFGGKYYGGYDGHISGGPVVFGTNGFNLEQSRKLLKWEQPITLTTEGKDINGQPIVITTNYDQEGAVSQMTQFGNDFYSRQAYLNRHGSIKIYGKGDPDVFRMAMSYLIAFEIDRLARHKLNINRRVAVVGFPGYNEPLNKTNEYWLVTYRRTIQQGSQSVVIKRTTFPMWSYSIQIGLYFLALAMDFDFFSWESAERLGRDPLVTNLNYGPQDEPDVSYEGDIALIPGEDRYRSSVEAGRYALPGEKPPYPLNPQGGMDLPLVAADMYTFINQHVGFVANGVWVKHAIKSGDSYGPYTSITPDYLIDRYVDGLPGGNATAKISPGIAMGFRNGLLRGLFYINMALPAGQSETVKVDLNGDTHEFLAYGGVPYCFRGQLQVRLNSNF